jgi:hypothetical protein
MPDPLPITRTQGCIRHPEHVSTDALAALARSQGATHHHTFHGEDGTRWFEWWQQRPLPPDAPLWPYPSILTDDSATL